MTNENLEKIKTGDVIVITNRNCIALVNKLEKNECGLYELYTYAELYNVNIFFEKKDPGCSYLLDDIQFRFATKEEKYVLYNAIGKYFTEKYDIDWYNHFTDSSYFDIQDFLLDMFCIKVEEYDNDLIYPDFINDIHQHIWNRLCEVTNENVKYNKKLSEIGNHQIQDILDNMGMIDENGNCPYTVEEIFRAGMEYSINICKKWLIDNVDLKHDYPSSNEEIINDFIKAME